MTAREERSAKPKVISVVVGARPNFMKAAPVLKAIHATGTFRTSLVHTGQHYDTAMSGAFFADLELPTPDVQLGVGSGTHAEQTARIMTRYEQYVGSVRPWLVIVFGDVNSTLACGLVAAKAGIRLAHVEAGLRSFDRSMPEEINRLVTDSLSDLLFTTSADANDNLRREGHPEDAIHLVGNTMIDTLEACRHRIGERSALGDLGVPEGRYILVTLHRPANVDSATRLAATLRVLGSLPLRVVLPLHPRTRAVVQDAGLGHLLDALTVLEPTGYLDSLRLQAHADLVITDSGGIQEETTVLGIPCLTFRDNTERPITLTEGTNRLIGTNPDDIPAEVARSLGAGRPQRRVPALWDGRAAGRIASVLVASS